MEWNREEEGFYGKDKERQQKLLKSPSPITMDQVNTRSSYITLFWTRKYI